MSVPGAVASTMACTKAPAKGCWAVGYQGVTTATGPACCSVTVRPSSASGQDVDHAVRSAAVTVRLTAVGARGRAGGRGGPRGAPLPRVPDQPFPVPLERLPPLGLRPQRGARPGQQVVLLLQAAGVGDPTGRPEHRGDHAG